MMSFKEKDLKESLRAMRDEEIRELPGGDSILSGTGTKSSHRSAFRRKAAVALMTLAVLGAGFFALNPKAYAAVVNWIRGEVVKETSNRGDEYSMMVYELPETGDKTAQYRFGWRPERFEKVEYLSKELTGFDYCEEYSFEISGATPDAPFEIGVLGIGYAAMGADRPKTYFMVESRNRTLLENGSIERGTFSGEYYLYNTDYFDSFWVDSETGIYFRLGGNITKEEAFRIIDNVRRIR